MQKEIRYHVFPCFGYVGEEMWENDISLEEEIFRTEFPLYECLAEEMNLAYATEDAFLSWNDMRVSDYDEQILSENKTTDDSQLYDEMLHENQHAAIFARETDFFTCGSGFISEISALWITEFVKASSKSVEYEYDKLADYEFVMENFYTVDACTAAGPDVIRPEEFLAYDATVDKSAPGPHILIIIPTRRRRLRTVFRGISPPQSWVRGRNYRNFYGKNTDMRYIIIRENMM